MPAQRTWRSFGRIALAIVLAFLAILFLAEAWATLLDDLGYAKLGGLLLILALSLRVLVKKSEDRGKADDFLLYFLGPAVAFILFMRTWYLMGGGWAFLGGILLVLFAIVLFDPRPPIRTATRREAAEMSLAALRRELEQVGFDSPRGVESRRRIAELEAQLADWPKEWDAEDARRG